MSVQTVLKVYFIHYLIILFISLAFFFNIRALGSQQFTYLARSFLHGKFYFLEEPGGLGDTVYHDGKYYWPLGPFPSVTLIPFVFFFDTVGLFFSQGYLNFFLTLLIFYLTFKIAQKTGFSDTDSLYLAFAFCFASVFLGVAFLPLSWYFSQTLTVFFLLLTIKEFLGKKRYWLLGVLFALILTTRPTAVLGVTFFLLDIFFFPQPVFTKGKKLFTLFTPILTSLIMLVLYNYFRFGSFLENGYSNQILIASLVKARSYGIFNLIHLPGNLYYAFFSMPVPVHRDNLSLVLNFPYIKANPFGMSIFVTSPYYLGLFFMQFKDRVSKQLLITITVIALGVFLYYGIGYYQFGYRYSLDFLPFLFFLFIRNYHHKQRQLSKSLKFLIVVTALTNLYLFATLIWM